MKLFFYLWLYVSSSQAFDQFYTNSKDLVIFYEAESEDRLDGVYYREFVNPIVSFQMPQGNHTYEGQRPYRVFEGTEQVVRAPARKDRILHQNKPFAKLARVILTTPPESSVHFVASARGVGSDRVHFQLTRNGELITKKIGSSFGFEGEMETSKTSSESHVFELYAKTSDRACFCPSLKKSSYHLTAWYKALSSRGDGNDTNREDEQPYVTSNTYDFVAFLDEEAGLYLM